MQNLLFDELCIKRTKKHFLIFAIVCVAAVSVLYRPIYVLLSSNVIWRGSIILDVLTELIEPLIDFSFYWGSFAFLIYTYLRFGKKQIGFFTIVAVTTIVARQFLPLLVGYLIMSFPDASSFFGLDFPSALLTIGMDALQMLGVLLLAEFCCRRPLMRAKTYSKGAVDKGIIADCFPLEGLFDLKKPLQKLCFFAALVPAGLKILSRIYYDIVWGMPTEVAEWLLMATYYIGDIASLLIGYFVLLYLLQMFYTNEIKRQTQFDS